MIFLFLFRYLRAYGGSNGGEIASKYVKITT